ncbi:hypothetical protein QUF84_25510 [Fictibacillus enclensis]|uniref:lipase family protein n=1 Tax=Fictibacillus enclensis TaxID=1017270 RepID=UPI00259FEBB8|nr:hypothetical protein [Fictibacillus enclensis]MDM5340553.1 hypothetical protein [Fictibacillus enclensis]
MEQKVRDKVYRTLSDVSYNPRPAKEIVVLLKDGDQTWERIDKKKYIQDDGYTGFDAMIFKQKGKHTKEEIIIAYRGTEGDKLYADGINDVITDAVNIVGKKKVDGAGFSMYMYDGKLDIDLKPKNQFTLAERLVKDVKKNHPTSHISVTGHSLGGALASYVAAKENMDAVTFNAPDVTALLPEDVQDNVHKGKFNDTIYNYVNPKDSIGAGSFVEYKNHIGSTYYIGNSFELENKELRFNPIARFWNSIAGEQNHKLHHFNFDQYGNLNNNVMLNASTGQPMWQSPRFYSQSVATIEVTPQHLKNASKELKQFISKIDNICDDLKRTAYSLDGIQVFSHVVDEAVYSTQSFKHWFNERTNGLCKTLDSKADGFARADGTSNG